MELPQEKKTTIGLYVTAKDAYEMWKIDPGKVNVLDVRTPEEYIYIGHAAMARNIPLLFQTYKWDTDKMNFPMKPNPDFIKQIQQVFKQDDTILVTCRSGARTGRGDVGSHSSGCHDARRPGPLYDHHAYGS